MKRLTAGVAGLALALGFGAAMAELPENYTFIEPPEDHPLSEIISGYEFRNPATQAIQDDDFENPGFIVLEQGQELWEAADGEMGKSCADCHGDIETAMAGVGSTWPKITEKGEDRTLRNIENQINYCRENRMGAEPWKYDKPNMLALTVAIRAVDRGKPMSVAIDGDYAPWFEKGKELYYLRTGQLDLSCANCHEDNYGNYIRADHLSQGQTNGFPVYRLKWQGLGSLHRRLNGCVKDTRSSGYGYGSDENLALELYLGYRGMGLPIETPSVRN